MCVYILSLILYSYIIFYYLKKQNIYFFWFFKYKLCIRVRNYYNLDIKLAIFEFNIKVNAFTANIDISNNNYVLFIPFFAVLLSLLRTSVTILKQNFLSIRYPREFDNRNNM